MEDDDEIIEVRELVWPIVAVILLIVILFSIRTIFVNRAALPDIGLPLPKNMDEMQDPPLWPIPGHDVKG